MPGQSRKCVLIFSLVPGLIHSNNFKSLMGHGWYRKKTIQFRGQLLIIVLIGSWNENYTPQEQSSISREYFARYGGTFIIDNQPSGRNRTVVNSGQTQENKTRINRAKEERWVWFDNGFGLHLQLLLLLLPCTIVCYERCRQKNLTRTPPNHHLIYPSSSVPIKCEVHSAAPPNNRPYLEP